MERPVTKTNVHAAPAHAAPCSLPTVTWTMGGGTGGIRCDGLLTSADYGEGEAFPGDNSSKEPAYNSFGALVSDCGRGITSVSYDSFGNPVRIQCSGNRSVTNVYSATGEKLKTVHALNVAAQAAMSLTPDVECASVLADGTDVVGGADPSTTEYHGSLVYRDGRLDMVLFPGGYATVSGATVTFHYYTRDYLGNNRAVVNGLTGALEQTVAYYPYGGVIPDISTNPTTVQPYKFGGKELITANGLNEYDFGARQYYSAVPGFTKPDSMCEKYYWLSPYIYCANNPVNAFDPDGNIIIFINGMHFGDGGKQQYWNGVDNTIKQLLQDKKAVYIDGSFGGFINTLINDAYSNNIKASNRMKMGIEVGALYAKTIYDKLTDGETIKIISHSMGGATAKGFLQSLLEYAKENNIEHKIAFELDMAPFQWAEQKGNAQVPTYTISHKSDRLAGVSNMKNAINFHSEKEADNPNPLEGHKIGSFNDEVIRLIREGKIETSVKY